MNRRAGQPHRERRPFIVRDCDSDGVAVRVTDGADVVNATQVGNPTPRMQRDDALAQRPADRNGAAEVADSASALATSCGRRADFCSATRPVIARKWCPKRQYCPCRLPEAHPSHRRRRPGC